MGKSMSPMDRRHFLTTTAAASLASLAGARDALAQMDLLGVRPEPGLARAGDFSVHPVPLARVNITDAFWRPRMAAVKDVSLPYCFNKFEGNDGFSVSKLVEAAAHFLTKQRDAALESYVDGRVDAMVANLDRRAQSPDASVRVSGHFLEAAVAYSEATGKRKMLDAAIRVADQMDSVYGPGKKTYISGHEGLKMGLIALYRATNNERYWKLAKFFADERGKDDYPRTGEYARDRTYAQDHKPVVKQDEAVGHAVRATFLYIPMADIAALAQSKAYEKATDRIWEDAVEHKTYLTGGIGSIRFHEQFGAAYELPNLSAWNETCAAYGNVVWNQRMFQLHRDARYIDVMERVLYNALLVGVSLKGDRFFYQNPLVSFGDYERFDWINTPCCPPNTVRMIAAVGSYVYATDANDQLYVNLFVEGDADLTLAGKSVKLRQETRYPWDGGVKLHVDPPAETAFTMHLRIPGWTHDEVMPGGPYRFVDRSTEQPTLRVNGAAESLRVENGYARVTRTWRAGDVVELNLPMPVRQVVARDEVRDDRARVALQRGPLVYCAEWPDNGGRALNIVIADGAQLRSEYRADLLGGTQVITGAVQAIARDGERGPTRVVSHQLTAIPYYLWANRGMGEMAVWLAREPSLAWLPPVLPDGIKQITHSGGVEKGWTGYNDQNDDLGAVYDGREPLNSADQSHRFFRMRPPVGQPAWLQYEFVAPTEISSAEVYFFDDKRFCKLPASWRVLYRAGDAWKPVDAKKPYVVKKDAFSTIAFAPVRTTAVRIEVEPQTVQYKSGDIGPPAAMFISEDIAWREFGLIEWRVT
jgi:uncharacterized protein